MDRTEAASVIKRYLTCTDITHNCNGKCEKCRYHTSDEEKEVALKVAIEALEGKDIDVPTKSALDHIHNVVSENERKRGYKTAKEEYDHKLAEIKSIIKDHYYHKGYEDGKADATEWHPVSDRLPGEKINPNTHDFEEVLCSTTFGDVRAYKFGTPLGWKEPHFWNGPGKMDEYVLAWAEKPKPWKGVRYGTVI